MRMWLYRSALGLLFLCMPWSFCTAADLLVVVSNVPVENYRDVDIAADYYGVGTEIVHDPSACSRVLRELEEELAALGVDRAADVIGQAHGSHGRFSRGTARPADSFVR